MRPISRASSSSLRPWLPSINRCTVHQQFRDWSSLPSDLLLNIANKLTIPQRVLMRRVCSSWRSAIPAENVPSPWLILPGVGSYIEQRTTCIFLSVAANRTFRSAPLQALDCARCVGSYAGWLVMAYDIGLDIGVWKTHNNFSRHTVKSWEWYYICHDIYLQPQVPCSSSDVPSWIITAHFITLLTVLNPITGAMFRLPSFETLPPIQHRACNKVELDDHLNELHKRSRCWRYLHVKKVLFCPVSHNDFRALAIFDSNPGLQLAYLRAGDQKWTFFETGVSYLDITYHDGKFYGLTDRSAEVKVFDFVTVIPKSPPKIAVFIPNAAEIDYFLRRPRTSIGSFHQYLAFSDSGEPLLIFRRLGLDKSYSPAVKKVTKYFVVMKYTNSWNQVEDLNGQSIFIGNNNSFTISCTKQQGLQSNCIYFTDSPSIDFEQSHHMYRTDIGVFNLETRMFERLVPPNTELNWPPPVWLQPHL